MDATIAPRPAPIEDAARGARRALWAGRAVSALPTLFLSFDAAIKLAERPEVAEATARLGLPPSLSVVTGAIEALCLVLYWVPRTAALGAVLLTGFFGGAVLAHARIGDPLATHTLFPVYVAVLVWAGLALRDPRVRALLSAPG